MLLGRALLLAEKVLQVSLLIQASLLLGRGLLLAEKFLQISLFFSDESFYGSGTLYQGVKAANMPACAGVHPSHQGVRIFFFSLSSGHQLAASPAFSPHGSAL